MLVQTFMVFIARISLVQYEPELFPGLIYRMKQPKIVLLIFVSGKIVLTGAKVINVALLGFSFISSCAILRVSRMQML